MENFADPIDAAQNIQDGVVAMTIQAIRNKPRELLPKGSCHWCKEPLESLQLFCDTDCNHDYDKNKQNQR